MSESLTLLLIILSIGLGGIKILDWYYADASREERFVLGWGIGLVVYVMLLNFGTRLGIAPLLMGWISIAVLFCLGCLLPFKPLDQKTVSGPSFFSSLDFSFITLFVLLNCFHAFLFYLFKLDDDFMMHFPIINFYRADICPPMNPFFPDFGLSGHFARNLLMGVLSGNSGMAPESIIQWMSVLLSAYSVLAFYTVIKEVTGSTCKTAFVTAFVFFALKGGFSDFLLRGGLFEMVDNNNPLVLVWTLVLLHVSFAFSKSKNLRSCIMTGLILGAFGFVYESYLPFLAIGLILAVFMKFGNELFRPKCSLAILIIFLSSLTMVLTQGGVFADLAFRGSRDVSTALAGVTQQQTIHFPKIPFLEFTHVSGKSVPIFAWAFLKDQGWPLWILPFSLIWAWRRRQILAASSLCIGALAILTPSVIDLGRFNADTYRLLIFSSFAIGLGTALVVFDLISFFKKRKKTNTYRWILSIFILVGVVLLSSGVFRDRMTAYLNWVWKNSTAWYLSPSEKVLNIYGQYAKSICAEDKKALELIREDAKKRGIRTPRILVITENPDEKNNIFLLTFISSWAKVPTTGAGLAIPRSRGNMHSLDPNLYASGFRARAYQETGAPELLISLGANYLYVLTDNRSGIGRNKWFQYGKLKFLSQVNTPSGERLIFLFTGAELSRWKPEYLPPQLVINSKLSLEPGEFGILDGKFAIPLREDLTLRQVIRYEGEEGTIVNEMDAIVQVFVKGTSQSMFYITAPFLIDKYWIEYEYLDREGSWKSIKMNKTELTVVNSKESSDPK